MSLATRCPACGTTFKVVKDQLRISDGWVRCGRCSQVFDASAELQEVDESKAQAPVSPLSAPREDESASQEQSPVEAPPVAEGEAEADFIDDDGDSPDAVVDLHPPEPTASEPLPLDVQAPASASGLVGAPWPDASLLSFEDEAHAAVGPPEPPSLFFPDIDLSLSPTPASAPEATVVAEPASISDAAAQPAAESAPVVLAASEPEPGPVSALTMPSLFGASQSSAFWRRTAVRRSLGAVAALAALLLVGQVVYQERDLIVARQSALRPALSAMCRVLGCEISALRQISDIKVDGASFSREKDDEGYRLNFTLRNGAEIPLAMPAVELSLLDTQERAVVRRVLMPSDFGAPSVLPARGERSASLSLKLTGAEAALMPPVAGFRVEALYP